MRQFRDPYKVLMVDPEADREVIQAAYRQLARKFHPDRGADLPPDAPSRMVEINAAWELLGDPARRADYDRERAASTRRSTPMTNADAEHRSPDGRPFGRSASSDRMAGSSEHAVTSQQPQWAGPPPGRESGSVLTFGRYSGWSLGEIGRVDPAYLDWLERTPIGRPYRSELQAMIRASRKPPTPAQAAQAARKGLFDRR